MCLSYIYYPLTKKNLNNIQRYILNLFPSFKDFFLINSLMGEVEVYLLITAGYKKLKTVL